MTHSPKSWGRHPCLLNAAHPSMNCARTTSTQKVAQAGVGLCAVVPRAFEKRPSSRGPFTGRRISVRSGFEAPRIVTAHPVATHLIISNRSARRLELPETYTKQRTGPLSNRHKFTHHLLGSTGNPACGRAPRVNPARLAAEFKRAHGIGMRPPLRSLANRGYPTGRGVLAAGPIHWLPRNGF